MRVLLITGSYPPMKCGVGAYTQRLAQALAEYKDVDVAVLTDSNAFDDSVSDGVVVFPVIQKWRLTGLLTILTYLKKFSPDIVHIQYPTQGYSGKMPVLIPLMVKLLGKYCVQTWHEPSLGKAMLVLSFGLDALITVRDDLMSRFSWLTKKILRRTSIFLIPASSLLPVSNISYRERAAIRRDYISDEGVMLVYFGFISPLKGIEVLLEIVLRTRMYLLMVCDLDQSDTYQNSLLNKIIDLGIVDRVKNIGFVNNLELSRILSVADAVVLPFRDGAQYWNTSIDGAVAQGTFVVTTSLVSRGYDPEKNIFYTKPGDVDTMISALNSYAGVRIPTTDASTAWRRIAEKHLKIYTDVRGL